MIVEVMVSYQVPGFEADNTVASGLLKSAIRKKIYVANGYREATFRVNNVNELSVGRVQPSINIF
uniref:Uncharacterized protein n=1 Tax=Daphnia galeata TaxID=27404 RepID=A0A8J2S228_9CRUS|nr:unnamed protein product [Daphnia galeata]